MNALPQTAKISDFKNHPSATLKRIEASPVIIMQRSEPKAVLVSVQQWDATAAQIGTLQERVAQFEVMEAHRRVLAGLPLDDMETVTQEQLDHQMAMTMLTRERLHEMVTDPSTIVLEDEYEQLLAEAGLTT